MLRDDLLLRHYRQLSYLLLNNISFVYVICYNDGHVLPLLKSLLGLQI